MARLTDDQLFAAYGPRCSGRSAVVALNGAGKVTVAVVIVEAVKALNAVLVAWRYVTRSGDTGAYNCRQKVGGNGWSIHSLKIALDLNWTTNPYGPDLVTDMPRAMVNAVLAIRTNSGAQVWTWGGDWSGNKDAMHFQIACSLRDLLSGINWATVAGFTPNPPPTPPTTAARPTPAAPAPTTGDQHTMTPEQRDEVVTRLDELIGIARADHGAIAAIHPALMDPTSGAVKAIKDLAARPPGYVDAKAIAAAIPANLAQQVATELARRLVN